MDTKAKIYRVIFHSQDKIYELHARRIEQNSMLAFVEVSDIIFGERSKLVIDPMEEKLQVEFAGVKKTYIPLHAMIRIDEVEKEGSNKIKDDHSDKKSNITPFPIPPITPKPNY